MARKKSRKLAGRRRKSPGHAHVFTIADREAVETLVGKLAGSRSGENEVRQKLSEALEAAAGHYRNAGKKERQAFFHGLLTGYGVGLKLRR